MRIVIATVAVVFLLGVGRSSAFTWGEVGEAGMLPGSAQMITGAGAVEGIRGSIGDAYDADMYRIHIFDPGAFMASTVNDDMDETYDTRLFLFDMSGMGVSFHEDVSDSDYRSRLTSQFVPGAGDYLLAISSYDYGPQSELGDSFWDIWLDIPWQEERRPDGPGAGAPVSLWWGNGLSGGDYLIELNGVDTLSEIPEPSTMILLGIGSCAALIARRRRRESR